VKRGAREQERKGAGEQRAYGGIDLHAT
jgi:hypothetical protein